MAGAVKLMAPADSSAISKVTSPSCLPPYSSAVIWNGPSTVPKSGMTSCQSTIAASKNFVRIDASDAASLKMPEPDSDAALHAAAGQKFAPAPGRIRVGHVDRLAVEGEPLGAQPRHRDEGAEPRRSRS